jgi:predicted aldo/keto reductase-like oxidoreductase
MNTGRRDFIKKSILGFAGATLIPAITFNQNPVNSPHGRRKFICRKLGKTNIALPIISMGVMNADNPNLVSAALDAGIVHLDTAWVYQRGRNEEMIGRVIKGRLRESFTIATKIWEPKDNRTGEFLPGAAENKYIEKCEESLSRLNLKHVDILYSHDIATKNAVLFEPYLNALLKLKRQGKARFIGVSTHRNEPEVIRAAMESGVYDVVLTSYNFKQRHHQEIAEAAAEAAKAGLGIVGMKAIAGFVQNIGKQVQVNAKAALKWAMQNENIHTNVPGFTNFLQLEEDLSVMEDLRLTLDEKSDLEKHKQLAGLFCQNCGECRPQCPAGVDVPIVMRSYMYAMGYGNLQTAQDAIDMAGRPILSCPDCHVCQVQCSQGFDVRQRALDLLGLPSGSICFG